METVVQVALDFITLKKALDVGRLAVDGGVDWVEAGTPLIKSEGLQTVKKLRKEFPDKKIVADMKTIDTGGLEVELAGKAGADVVSIFGGAADKTIKESVKAAKKYDLEIVGDLIAFRDLSVRAPEIESLGVDYIGVHTGIDQQETGESPLELVKSVRNSVKIPISSAGGLDSESAPKAVQAGASIIVVGSAITKVENPKKAAEDIVKSVRG